MGQHYPLCAPLPMATPPHTSCASTNNTNHTAKGHVGAELSFPLHVLYGLTLTLTLALILMLTLP